MVKIWSAQGEGPLSGAVELCIDFQPLARVIVANNFVGVV